MAVDVEVDGWADSFHRSASLVNNDNPLLHDVDRSSAHWLRRGNSTSLESAAAFITAKSPVRVPGTAGGGNNNRYAAALLPINNNFNNNNNNNHHHRHHHHHHPSPSSFNLGCSPPPTTFNHHRGVRGGAATSDDNMDFVKDTFEHVTSPAAKRTYLRTFLVLATSLVLLGIAALAYPIFYYSYVPKKVVSIPIHLQYNAGLNPYGIAHLSSQLATEQAYDVSVELTLPRSPSNLERGNFMVALYALKSQVENPAFSFSFSAALLPPPPSSPSSSSSLSPADPYAHVTRENVVFSSRRPALLPYRDPLVSRASRLLFLPYHVLFPAAEATATLAVAMGERVALERELPLSLLLDVQAGQGLQVYAASVTLVARLEGLRWAMYNYRVLSFAAGTAAFWLAEVLAMGAAWLLVAQCFSGRSGGGGARRPAKLEDEGDGRAGRRLRGTAPPYREEQQAGTLVGLKQEDDEEEDVKAKEESTEQETLVGDHPQHGGDADDEQDGDDNDDVWRESRSGTSGFHDGKGGSIKRRSFRGGGIRP